MFVQIQQLFQPIKMIFVMFETFFQYIDHISNDVLST